MRVIALLLLLGVVAAQNTNLGFDYFVLVRQVGIELRSKTYCTY